MVKIKTINGRHKTKLENVFGDVDPNYILAYLLKNGFNWEIDYSNCGAEEAFNWGKADFMFRCIQAIRKGYLVYLCHKTYTRLNQLNDLEETVINSTCLFSLKASMSNRSRLNVYFSIKYIS